MLKNRFWNRFMPMMEADGGAGGGSPSGSGAEGANAGAAAGAAEPQNQQPGIDYDKLAGIIAGKQTEAESTILKNYFKQQGLAQADVEKAIASYKEQKAKNEPDVMKLQQDAVQAATTAQKAVLERDATLAAVGLGIDAKAIPYVLKLADFSAAVGDDGTVKAEEVTKALNKVLEDLPQFKGNTAGSTDYKPKGGGDPGKTSRAAAIAAARKETTDNPYASAWGQK